MLNGGNFKRNNTVDTSEVCFISVFEVAALMVINYISHRCDNVPLTVLTSAIQTRPILSTVCRNAGLFLFRLQRFRK